MALLYRHDDPVSSPTAPLDFSQPGGPLVALAGLCGGAGTSTFAHLLAAAAAAQSSAPILLAETGGPSATQSRLADAQSQLSLVELARQVGAGRAAVESPCAAAADGLRVIAAGPQFERSVDETALELVLGDAQAAHGLTVVDCSSLTAPADLIALRRATHVIWFASATRLGADRARAVLAAIELPIVGHELLAIRQATDAAGVPATRWTAIAKQRSCDIVLVPHVPASDELPLLDRIDRASAALDALAGALR
jgi:hypothetical protein